MNEPRHPLDRGGGVIGLAVGEESEKGDPFAHAGRIAIAPVSSLDVWPHN